MMKITPAHIQKLYKFTRDHYVEHYDLQTELVDHLANGIEQLLEENPKLTFDEALQMEFKKFGVFGFLDVIEQHDLAMSKRYFKYIMRFMVQFFKLPQLIGTLTAIIASFYLLQNVSEDLWISGILCVLFFVYFTFTLSSKKRAYKAQLKKSNKRWKLKEMIFNFGNSGILMLIVYQLLYQFPTLFPNNVYAQFLNALLLVFIILFMYISTKILPEKAEELLRETYPEYELSE